MRVQKKNIPNNFCMFSSSSTKSTNLITKLKQHLQVRSFHWIGSSNTNTITTFGRKKTKIPFVNRRPECCLKKFFFRFECQMKSLKVEIKFYFKGWNGYENMLLFSKIITQLCPFWTD